MRIPISVQITPYDLERDQPTIDAIRHAFVEYIAGVPRKSTRSKHGLMGPVGKILNEIKSGRMDPASLKGYALRVHESSGKSPSAEAAAALEQGIDMLVELLGQVPTPYHDRLLDRLDYGLFFALRSAEC
jgi:hypothetical protein